MTEQQELKAKALELAVSLYTGFSEETKTTLFLDAEDGEKEDTPEAMVVDIAGTFLEYIS